MRGPERLPLKIMKNSDSSMKLYHVEWCPDCDVVRRKLAEHDFGYEHEIVPDIRPLRHSVYAVSGQYFVPVLVDGETVLTETEDILAYLDRKATNGEREPHRLQEFPAPPFSSSDERN